MRREGRFPGSAWQDSLHRKADLLRPNDTLPSLRPSRWPEPEPLRSHGLSPTAPDLPTLEVFAASITADSPPKR